MRFAEAAITVLRESRKPLTAGQIAAVALDRGFITSTGKTPEATMSAQLYAMVNREPDGPLQREFEPGPTRARRGSVKWRYLRNHPGPRPSQLPKTG